MPSASGSLCDSTMFRCGDGTCIPLSYACDGELDCNDGSDELCGMLPSMLCAVCFALAVRKAWLIYIAPKVLPQQKYSARIDFGAGAKLVWPCIRRHVIDRTLSIL